ncbi:hypothetical protein EDEG_03584 [Edhazardia aedis USNM 41457]|uniref:Uncharacterized protein n=1 Tax=Edhazardia aedis (strain USNM 41457) TaxID=1003232 RepID=J8ZQH7_EDHAE|nr:hypothetical protein EDEG_03584 [Edhazardia aedis USNM 41457]|eukprot:EJW01958.1 hypothetical protein EDEG_03584 [Edhazardia aedis USNM 41457]
MWKKDRKHIFLSKEEEEKATNIFDHHLVYYAWGLLDKESIDFLILKIKIVKCLKKSNTILNFLKECMVGYLDNLRKSNPITPSYDGFFYLFDPKSQAFKSLSNIIINEILKNRFDDYLFTSVSNIAVKKSCINDHRNEIHKKYLIFDSSNRNLCFDFKECYWHNENLSQYEDGVSRIYRANVCKFACLRKDFCSKIATLSHEAHIKLFECTTVQFFECCGYLILDMSDLIKIEHFSTAVSETVMYADFRNAGPSSKKFYRKNGKLIEISFFPFKTKENMILLKHINDRHLKLNKDK